MASLWDRRRHEQGEFAMNRQSLVHQIRLGAVQASIWEESSLEEAKYRVTVSRVHRSGERPARADQFDADHLPLLAELADMAHLWICEQAELIA
jgi:hypothetical protein